MKKILFGLTAGCAIAAAAPAAAQYSNQNNVNTNAGAGIQDRIARLEARIQAGVQAGTIDRTEARNLRMQLRTITRLERQYSRNGLNQQERADLQQRVRSFREQFRLAGGTGYGNGQNGGYDNDVYAQGGPYETCDTGSSSSSGVGGGLGGIIDSIFGGGNTSDCAVGLRVGQRATGNLSSLPYQYRSQYRDGSGVYYRTDGSQIYQIDARTGTVVRIYSMNR